MIDEYFQHEETQVLRRRSEVLRNNPDFEYCGVTLAILHLEFLLRCEEQGIDPMMDLRESIALKIAPLEETTP